MGEHSPAQLGAMGKNKTLQVALGRGGEEISHQQQLL